MNALASHVLVGVIATLLTVFSAGAAEEAVGRLRELDSFWAEVSRTVREGDFEGYKATCHPEGVLVAGIKQFSQPLAKALERWQPEFIAAKAGKTKTSVAFRFSQRMGDATTAFEKGIFLYSSTTVADGIAKDEYIHFEVLLVKKDGWKTMMEYQKSKATKEEWDALKSSGQGQ
jgi:hypothetical protein